MDMPCNSAGRGCRATLMALLLRCGSLCLDPRDSDDPFRTVDLAAHEASELGGRHGHRLGAQPCQALAHLRPGDDLREGVRDLFHDRPRRSAWCPEAVSEGRFELPQ